MTQSFFGNLLVKEFWKLVYICRSYDQKSSVLFFFDSQCTCIFIASIILFCGMYLTSILLAQHLEFVFNTEQKCSLLLKTRAWHWYGFLCLLCINCRMYINPTVLWCDKEFVVNKLFVYLFYLFLCLCHPTLSAKALCSVTVLYSSSEVNALFV